MGSLCQRFRPSSLQDFHDVGDERLSDDPAAGAYNRPDYISPLDDLAFDMYQDPEVAQIIRKLERKKQEAVIRKWNGNITDIVFNASWCALHQSGSLLS